MMQYLPSASLENATDADQLRFFQEHDVRVFAVMHDTFYYHVDKIKCKYGLLLLPASTLPCVYLLLVSKGKTGSTVIRH